MMRQEMNRLLLIAFWVVSVALQPQFAAASADSDAQLDAFIENEIIGEHALSLQWLDNYNRGNRGSIDIKRSGDQLVVTGYQEENDDGNLNYMKISGRLGVVSEKELLLDGEIETRVHHINGGQALFRSGQFHFKAWGKRRYWRLQNNRTHEVTDYIDIHFKPK